MKPVSGSVITESLIGFQSDGWNTTIVSFRVVSAYFQGPYWLLVSGWVFSPEKLGKPRSSS